MAVMPGRFPETLYNAIKDADEDLACKLIEELEIDFNEQTKDLVYSVPLLDAIVEDKEQEATGCTLLHLAAREGLLRVVRLLIQLGADLEARVARS